jgi:hypothetical protein
MRKKIHLFISYDFNEDDHFKAAFLQNLKQKYSEIDIVDLSFTLSVSKEIWESELEKRLEQCDLVVVLVGQYTSIAIGVLKEIEICKRLNLPIHIVYTLQNTSLCPLPAELDLSTTTSNNSIHVFEESLNAYSLK